ncbi:hypothetical protein BDV37DRAFT_267381 [Aspergillus pseudonomiae]|nr:uncharacterized protein BDV37DRAFT_267381 [Aspergillus pseudonomiae]KAE8396784.1 hypothetical protein BDV37DRAFT_267381 [Aspergillus pseudonomiae]
MSFFFLFLFFSFLLNGGVGGIKLTLGRTKAKLRSLFIGWAEQSRKTLRQRNVQFDPTDSLFLSPCAPDGGLLLSRDFCPRLKHPNFSAPLFIVSLATTPPFLLTMGKLTSTIGIPIKLLNEAQGHVVTLEITSGVVYRGKLLEAEDNMNVQLKDITVTARDGRVSHLDQVYIRGSHVRFFIVPDMLRNAPMFRSRGQRGRGVGLARGKATVQRARGQRRG